jgi:PAS domain-containing protein
MARPLDSCAWQLNVSDTLHMKLPESDRPGDTQSLRAGLRSVERRQWWLSFSGMLVTLLFAFGIVSLSVTIFILQRGIWDALNVHLATLGLVGMVFLFVICVVYQQLQIHRFRVHVLAQEELFSLIGENAADMIAAVTANGEHLYNSPSYQKLLGYTSEKPTKLRLTNRFVLMTNRPSSSQQMKRKKQELATLS